MDALKAISILEKSCLTFDVIYVDPPFENNLYNECLNVLSGSQLLKASTLVVVEHNKKNILGKFYGKLFLDDQRVLGGTTLSFYHLKNV
jgi:16S rRNA G966 N2-methylase RsmD